MGGHCPRCVVWTVGSGMAGATKRTVEQAHLSWLVRIHRAVSNLQEMRAGSGHQLLGCRAGGEMGGVVC